MFIFYVDDDPDDCVVFTEVIKHIDPAIMCLTTLDSQQGLNSLRTDFVLLPDFLFLDVNMPVKDGIECLMEIRKNLNLSELTVVMFSTSLSPANREVFEMFNAIYVEKPMTYEKYVQVLKELIDNKRNLQFS